MTFILPEDAQKILSSDQIFQKINRMAYEILELCYKEKEIVIIGIEDGGYKLAEWMVQKIKNIQDISIQILPLYINKENPYSEKPSIRGDVKSMINKPIILVDDVGNTGQTLFHALHSIYPLSPKSLHVAVLIDRTHKRFPIKSDIIGMDLATTLTEHIHLLIDKDGQPEGVYLF